MNRPYLADKSALERGRRLPEVGERLGRLGQGKQIYTCPMVDWEVLFSARNLREYQAVFEERRSLPDASFNQAVVARVYDIQHALAEQGQHRCPIPDLIIAATAAEADLTVLHYGADFERIAKVSGIRHEWVVERGSVD